MVHRGIIVSVAFATVGDTMKILHSPYYHDANRELPLKITSGDGPITIAVPKWDSEHGTPMSQRFIELLIRIYQPGVVRERADDKPSRFECNLWDGKRRGKSTMFQTNLWR